jgi:hypothetical protein
MRPAHRFAIATALFCALGVHAAGADNLDWYATAAGSVATTDNKNGSPGFAGGRAAGLFADVRPGMMFTYNVPRHIHELLTEVSLFYNMGADKPNVTFRAGYKNYLAIGPRSEGSITFDVSKGQLNALDASTPSDSGALLVRPAGRVETLQLSGGANFSWQASKFSRIFERAFARTTSTDDSDPMSAVETRASEVGAAIGFDRRLRKHNFIFEGGGAFVYLDKFDPFIRQSGSRRDHQLNPRGVAIWQYDMSRRWSTNLDAGLVYVNPITDLFGRTLTDPYNPERMPKGGPFPTFGGVVAYSDVWGRATLNIRRQVVPNLLVAQNTVSDSAMVTFAMPLKFLDKNSSARNPKVVGLGTAGYDRTQLYDPDAGELRGTFHVARIDFQVAWQPRKGQTLGLRYELTYQNGDSVGELVIPSFVRNTFYFTYALRYPEEVQVRVPRRGQSVRADKGDLAPIGAEPVVVDPAELLNQE